jgi:hypothetical protein
MSKIFKIILAALDAATFRDCFRTHGRRLHCDRCGRTREMPVGAIACVETCPCYLMNPPVSGVGAPPPAGPPTLPPRRRYGPRR